MRSNSSSLIQSSGLTALLCAILIACVHEPLVPKDGEVIVPPVLDECDPDVIYFQNDILPVLVSNCAKSGCHDSQTREEGIVLSSYENVMSSDVVEPGNPNDSELYERITDSDPDDVMPPPPHQRLSTEQIASIRTWIQQGAKDTSCAASACSAENVTYAGSIKGLVTNKCVGCHSGNTPSGGLNFTTHAGLQLPALDGRLYGAITHAAGYTPMPQGGNKLSQCEIDMIKIWIDAGAPNN
jgi:mono/diheme cytochrome c family protein